MRAFFRQLREGFFIALRAIGTHRMRSVLTTLGIIVGIVAVTLMATVINGLERNIEESLSRLGSDVFYVTKWPIASGPGFKWWEYRSRPEIQPELAEVVDERARHVAAVAAVVERGSTARRDRLDVEAQVHGVSSSYPNVKTMRFDDGRFFTPLEARAARRIAVVGHRVAEELFPQGRAVGKTFRLGPHRLEIVGVLERVGSPGDDASEDLAVFLPMETYVALYGRPSYGVRLEVRARSAEAMDETRDELTGVLRVARGLDAFEQDDFDIGAVSNIRETFAPVLMAIYGVGIFLTALSLLVGGIGVMNIMFVSVKERTREIGLRKALGATPGVILGQFLIEAVVVCLLGGLIGVGLSYGFSFILAQFFPAVLPFGTVLIALGVCVLVGVLSGILPARAAAKSDPIEALRYE